MKLTILSIVCTLTLLASAFAWAEDTNPELELAAIAEQQAVKPLIDRVCTQVQYLDTTYTELQCETVVKK